jgi:hypothetical protein
VKRTEVIVALTLALAAGAGCDVRAQIIDTAVWPYVTADDTVNTYLKRLSGVDVVIDRPKIHHSKGVEVVHGFKKYYIYIVSSKLVTINGVPLLDTVERRIYLLVTAPYKKIALDSLPVIYSRALFLLGMYDIDELELQAFALYVADCKNKADSVLTLIEGYKNSGRPIPSRMLSGYQAMCDEVDISAHLYRLYSEFIKVKKKKRRLSRFFTGNAFNNRSLRYNAISSPYGLPEIRKEEETQSKSRGRPDSSPVKYEDAKPAKGKEAFKEQRPDEEYEDFKHNKDGD